MTDDVKAAVERLRRDASGDADDPTARAAFWDDLDALLAHLDGEPARLAAAREEQWEACEVEHDGLRKKVDEWRERAQKAQRERNEAEAERDELRALLSQRCDGIDCDKGEECVRLTRERDALRAQVERVRELEAQWADENRSAAGFLRRAEKAEAELDKARRRTDEFAKLRDEWRDRAQRAQSERDEAVRALRRLSDYAHGEGFLDVRAVLAKYEPRAWDGQRPVAHGGSPSVVEDEPVTPPASPPPAR